MIHHLILKWRERRQARDELLLTPAMIVTPGERVIERRTRASLSRTAHSRAAVRVIRADPLWRARA